MVEDQYKACPRSSSKIYFELREQGIALLTFLHWLWKGYCYQ